MVCHSDEPVDSDGRRLVVSGEFAAEQSFEESNGRQGTAARRFLMATSTFFFWKQMAIAIQDRGTSLAPCLVVLVELINPYRYSST